MDFPTYPKINGLWKRSPDGRKVLFDERSQPEFDQLAYIDWIWTEKIDGTNTRICWTAPPAPGEKPRSSVALGGRTDNAQMYAPFVEALMDMTDRWPDFTDVFDRAHRVVFYGEGVGPKVHAGAGRYADKPTFILFDILVTRESGTWWLRREDVMRVAEKLGIPTVDVVAIGPLGAAVEIVGNGFASAFGDFSAEGLVGRPEPHLFDSRGRLIQTKIKAKDFK